MQLFSSSRRSPRPTTTKLSKRHPARFGLFHRKDKDRVAGGYKAALANQNTTRQGRKHAKRELKFMGREDEAHVPFMTKVKRALGIRSTTRRRTAGSRGWMRRS